MLPPHPSRVAIEIIYDQDDPNGTLQIRQEAGHPSLLAPQLLPIVVETLVALLHVTEAQGHLDMPELVRRTIDYIQQGAFDAEAHGYQKPGEKYDFNP